MEHSIPILICDEHEEIRVLLRDMLTKNGYFHLFEAQNAEETLHLAGKKDQFILIHKNLLNENTKNLLRNRQKFLIISQPEDKDTFELASLFGVKHIISFPYSSKSLDEKIQQMLA